MTARTKTRENVRRMLNVREKSVTRQPLNKPRNVRKRRNRARN